MGKINILDEKVSNMIAAGEVVEKPASMIKELLENSIDAKSTKIVINIKNNNRYVKISDNGSGMSKEDLLLSVERHATSKISKKEDLFNIITYGFRGEALSSISSVSKLRITSRDKESDIGSGFTSSGGKITGVYEVTRDIGTEIEVKDLFFNTPARLKFLKKEATEFRAIKDAVLLEALANPNVSITLLNNEKEVLKTSGRGMKNTIVELFGANVLENLTSFPLGFLGNLSLNRSNKDFIFVFINNRPVKSQLIENALIDGYYTKLMKGRYPFAILFLEVDPSKIDVNVHPTKKIVKFSDEKAIYDYVYNEIQEKLFGDDDFVAPVITSIKDEKFLKIDDFKNDMLEAKPMTFNIEENLKSKGELLEKENREFQIKENILDSFFSGEKEENILESNLEKEFTKKSLELKENLEKNEKNIKNSFQNYEKTDKLEGGENFLKEKVSLVESMRNFENDQENKLKKETPSENQKAEKKEEVIKKTEEKNNNYKIIGQLSNTYILIERNNNLEIYDQHIIHERILYKKLSEEYKNRSISIQSLLVPVRFKISNKEKELVENNLELLRNFGYEIDFFGENDLLVRAIPNFKFQCSIEELIRDLVLDLKNTKVKNTLTEESIIMSSCKGAIKANQKLSMEEMTILLEKLFEIEEYTCPHGRPILLKLPLNNIEKHFGRLGG